PYPLPPARPPVRRRRRPPPRRSPPATGPWPRSRAPAPRLGGSRGVPMTVAEHVDLRRGPAAGAAQDFVRRLLRSFFLSHSRSILGRPICSTGAAWRASASAEAGLAGLEKISSAHGLRKSLTGGFSSRGPL